MTDEVVMREGTLQWVKVTPESARSLLERNADPEGVQWLDRGHIGALIAIRDLSQALWRIVYWGHSAESTTDETSFLEMLATAEVALGLEYLDAEVRLAMARAELDREPVTPNRT